MNKNIYPLTFSPEFQDYIWGGRNLETILGRQIPDGIVAESWEISGHPAAPTEVSNGPLAGASLPELLDQQGLALVGRRSKAMLERDKFPLLIKLLDANKPLSVQVHPSDTYANTHENGELGKTEMWYILHAQPDAHLIYGLKPNVTPKNFRAELEAGTLESCLHKLPVKTGDALFIPAGTIHAIMEGIVLAEIQQNSNTTYRVYDWNRVGNDGKPRPLHVDKALDVINFDQVEPGPYQPVPIEITPKLRHETITACQHFNVERLIFEQSGSFAGNCDGETFEIWGITAGSCRVHWSGEPVPLAATHFILLPATLGQFNIEVVAPATLLRVYVPK